MREDLGFERAVLEAFRFLVDDYAFTCEESGPTMVRYESKNVGVQIYHGRMSYEIGVELGLLDDWASRQPPYRLLDVLQLEDAEGALPAPLQASTAHRVVTSVERVAELTSAHAKEALEGDRFYYRRLAVHREQRATDELRAQRAADLRKRAHVAWQAGDYGEVVALLGRLQDELTPAERKRLEIAEKRMGHQSP